MKPYSYADWKHVVLTDDGQRAFLAVRDFVQTALKQHGAVTAGKAMERASRLGDSFSMMACVDRLIELGEVRVVVTATECHWQHQVLVAA